TASSAPARSFVGPPASIRDSSAGYSRGAPTFLCKPYRRCWKCCERSSLSRRRSKPASKRALDTPRRHWLRSPSDAAPREEGTAGQERKWVGRRCRRQPAHPFVRQSLFLGVTCHVDCACVRHDSLTEVRRLSGCRPRAPTLPSPAAAPCRIAASAGAA